MAKMDALDGSAPARPLGRRVLEVFVAPRRLFAGFDVAPPWLDVLAISTAVAMIAVAAQPEGVFLEQMEGAVNRRGEPVEITSGPAEVVRYGRLLAMLAALVGHPLIAFGVAGVVTLLFTVVGGGSVPFIRYLAVTAHALLIPALGSLLGVALSLVGGDIFPLTLDALVPGLPEGSLAREILAGITPFQIWMVLVLAAGVAALDRRRGWAAAALVLLGTYLAVDVITALLV